MRWFRWFTCKMYILDISQTMVLASFNIIHSLSYGVLFKRDSFLIIWFICLHAIQLVSYDSFFYIRFMYFHRYHMIHFFIYDSCICTWYLHVIHLFSYDSCILTCDVHTRFIYSLIINFSTSFMYFHYMPLHSLIFLWSTYD